MRVDCLVSSLHAGGRGGRGTGSRSHHQRVRCRARERDEDEGPDAERRLAGCGVAVRDVGSATAAAGGR